MVLRYDPDGKLGPILVCFGGFLVMLTVGTIYAIGNMIPYIVSYIRMYGTPKTLTERSSSWMASVSMIFETIGINIGGQVLMVLGPRLTSLISGLLFSAGVALTYFTLDSFYLTLLTNSAMTGLAMGLAYTAPMACAFTWLPQRTGLAAGIILAGCGAGAFLFVQVQTFFINPHNLDPTVPNEYDSSEKYFDDPGILRRTRQAYLLTAGIYAVLQLIGSLLLVNRFSDSPEVNIERNVETDKLLKSSKQRQSPTSVQVMPTADEVGPRQVICQRAFYYLWLTSMLLSVALFFILSLYKSFGMTFIVDDHFHAIVGSAASVFNSLGRLAFGYVADRFTFKTALVSLCLITSVLLLSFDLTMLMGKPGFFIWVCLQFGCIGGTYAVFPTGTTRLFGKRHFSANYALVFTSGAVAVVIGAIVATSLQTYVGWTNLWFFPAATSGLAGMLAMSTRYFNV